MLDIFPGRLPHWIQGLRAAELLVPKLAPFAISLSTRQLFSCKTSIYAPKVHSWVGSWVGCFDAPLLSAQWNVGRGLGSPSPSGRLPSVRRGVDICCGHGMRRIKQLGRGELAIALISRFSRTTLSRSRFPRTATSTIARAKSSAGITWSGNSLRKTG